MPASTWTPGAVTSGLIQSPSGPRDENEAIMSACPGCAVPCAHVAITLVWPFTKAEERSARAVDVDRRQVVVVGLLVLLDRGCRGSSRPRRRRGPCGPCRCGRSSPRWQATTLPVAAPGGEVGLAERVLVPPPAFGSVCASTTGVGELMPLVSVTPETGRTSRRRRRSGAAWRRTGAGPSRHPPSSPTARRGRRSTRPGRSCRPRR